MTFYNHFLSLYYWSTEYCVTLYRIALVRLKSRRSKLKRRRFVSEGISPHLDRIHLCWTLHWRYSASTVFYLRTKYDVLLCLSEIIVHPLYKAIYIWMVLELLFKRNVTYVCKKYLINMKKYIYYDKCEFHFCILHPDSETNIRKGTSLVP